MSLVAAAVFHQIEVDTDLVFIHFSYCRLALFDLFDTDVIQPKESRWTFLNTLIVEQKVTFFAKNTHIVGVCFTSLTSFNVALALSHVHAFDVVQIADFSYCFELKIRWATQ